MSERPTPEQIKAFLDDLARISLRHGIMLEDVAGGGMEVRKIATWLGGYETRPDGSGGVQLGTYVDGLEAPAEDYGYGYIVSLDITQLSSHERLAIQGWVV